jgi:hypothetical protein
MVSSFLRFDPHVQLCQLGHGSSASIYVSQTLMTWIRNTLMKQVSYSRDVANEIQDARLLLQAMDILLKSLSQQKLRDHGVEELALVR